MADQKKSSKAEAAKSEPAIAPELEQQLGVARYVMAKWRTMLRDLAKR